MTNLLCRSSFSFGKSCVRIDEYVKKAKQMGYRSVGLADDFSLDGFPAFYEACHREGIHGVGGVRLAFRKGEGKRTGVLYPKGEKGYRNLCLLLSAEREEVEPGDLKPFGEDLAMVLEVSPKEGESLDPDFFLAFASCVEEFFLGVRIEREEEKGFARAVRAFGKDRAYQTVAFPRVDYLTKKGLFVGDLLKCNLENRPLTEEEKRHEVEGGPNFLLSFKTLSTLYTPEEIDLADSIAEGCRFDLFSQKRGSLFSFTGTEEGDEELFAKKVKEGMEKRGLNGREEYEERVSYEAEVIQKMGFVSYFLIVQDYVNYARDVGIRVGPGRGSAAGSLVSYALGITDVDPLAYGLSFERFLNPKRVTMPDVDVDFEDDRREEICDYLSKRYGSSRTAKIITFGSFKSRSAIRASALALNVPNSRIAPLSSSIPSFGSKVLSLEESLARSKRLQKLLVDPYYKRIYDLAKALEDLPTNPSVHAAGMIVADKDIYEQAPMSEGRSGVVCYEYPYMERMGFLKVDLLSLHYLTLIRRMEEIVRSQGRQAPDYAALKEDSKTYQTIDALDLVLIFQLDGEGIKKAIAEVEPRGFKDLVALLALYRPGPMDNIPTYAQNKNSGRIPSTGNATLDAILKETYGVVVYQEQILKIAHDVAGMDLGEADLLRRAISKKHLEEMERYQGRFVEGAMKNGMSRRDAQGVYDLILKFANYGFNKSHSVCYALITFALAYLKTHEVEAFYRVAFEEIGPGDLKFRALAGELERRGIPLLPASPSRSKEGETFFDGKCYLGLSRIKNLPDEIRQKIVSERDKKPFEGLGDFLLRSFGGHPMDARTFTSLIESGLFDEFGCNRKTLEENALPLLEFIDVALSPSQLPLLKEEAMSQKELVESFLRELRLVGVSLSIPLRKLFGEGLEKGRTVGIATEDGKPVAGGVVVNLANAYGERPFLLSKGAIIKPYDAVLFRPVVRGVGKLWEAREVKVVHPSEKHGGNHG